MDTQTENTEDTSNDVVPEESTTEVTPTETRETPTVNERPPQSRQDRKRQRIDVEAAQKERDAIRAELERERAENARRDREIAEMRGRWEASQRQTQQQDKHAEKKTKITNLRDQAWAQMALAAKSQGEESIKYRQEYQRLMDEADDIRDEIRAEGRWEKQRGEIAAQIPNPQAQQDLAWLNANYPWLATDEDAQALADSRIKILLQKGRPMSRELAAEAITWAAQYLKRGGHTAPTNGQRQLYAGIPAGEGPGGSERPRSIKMGRDEEALARAAYSHLEPKEAYKQWAKDMLSRDNDDE